MISEQEKYYSKILELGGISHLENIIENLSSHVEVYEKAMATIANPSEANAKTIFNYFVSKWRLWTMDNMQPMHYLIALDCLELWYAKHGVNYPHKMRLEEQRAYFEKQLENET